MKSKYIFWQILNAFVLLVSKIWILKVTYSYTGGIGQRKIVEKYEDKLRSWWNFDSTIITSSDVPVKNLKKFVLFVFELFSPKVDKNECAKSMNQVNGNVATEKEK